MGWMHRLFCVVGISAFFIQNANADKISRPSIDTPSEQSYLVLDEKEADFLAFCKDLYRKNATVSTARKEIYSIPRTLHFIHLKPEALSTYEEENIRQWIENNPGFKAQLWSFADKRALSIPELEQRKLADLDFKVLSRAFAVADSNQEREEIVRFEILLQEGGVYVDNTKEGGASLDPYLQKYDLFCSLDSENASLPCGSLAVGAAPGHPALKKMMAYLFSEDMSSDHELKEQVSSALKKALQDSSVDSSLRYVVIPSSQLVKTKENSILESDDLSSYVFKETDPHARDIDRLMNTSLARLKVKSQHFMSHFFALIALSLICVVMLAVIVIKIRQRYFS